MDPHSCVAVIGRYTCSAYTLWLRFTRQCGVLILLLVPASAGPRQSVEKAQIVLTAPTQCAYEYSSPRRPNQACQDRFCAAFVTASTRNAISVRPQYPSRFTLPFL